VLNENSVKYQTALDGPYKIWSLWVKEEVATPLYWSKGVVEPADLAIGENAAVLKNLKS
jgi:hypothetical protein